MFGKSLTVVAISCLAIVQKASAESLASLYHQCGGSYWSGPTACVAGATCVSQNQFYYQCVATTDAGDSSAVATEADTTTLVSTSSTTAVTYTSETSLHSHASATTIVVKPSSSSSSSSSIASTETSVSLSLISNGFSGSFESTRYYDCCKPSFSWPEYTNVVTHPVYSCDAEGNKLTDTNIQSGCVTSSGEQSAYYCNDQVGTAVNDTFSYGFVAAYVPDATMDELACSCLELTFDVDELSDKTFVVQITNTGTDLTDPEAHFDILMPGGGMGYYTNGCPSEFGSGYSWGQQYGGISSESECSGLPTAIQNACKWQWTWFEGVSNPSGTYKQVACPAEIVAISGCQRLDEVN
ncbi:hypothetical protein DASC09_060830 [Saccharomycopsis crataegensis]|uniref:cellulase n=1 Tax=Saccharomycopsis crataegensis TaxID=43959 RepID=A0AAV5QW45_9ASCO|nr:hypothetical protein DASC09_060830 [Saccharomycopsis crataegensis]